MVARVKHAIRILAPLLVLAAVALGGQAGQRWR